MTALAVVNPFLPFLAGGAALAGGKIYIGEPSQDPQSFPKAVYWDKALTIAAQQPLRTSGGYIWRNGAPGRPYVDGDFSVLVLDANDRQVFYAATSGGMLVSAFAETLLDDADAAAARTTLGIGSASEAGAGLVEMATFAEAQAGTSDSLAVSPKSLRAALSGMRNRIINGNFKVNQRGAASGSTAYGAGVFVMDRWKAGASGCTLSWATSGADVIVTISAGSLMQVVEGANIEGGVYALSNQGTAQARIAVNGGSTSGSYAAATTAAPLLSATATGGQTVTVEFSTGTLDRVQLEPGTVCSSFERRQVGVELALCQRYYLRWDGTAGSVFPGVGGYHTAGNTIFEYLSFPVQMRATPTATKVGTWNASNCSQPTIGGVSINGAILSTVVTATGGAVTQVSSVTTYLEFSAEL